MTDTAIAGLLASPSDFAAAGSLPEIYRNNPDADPTRLLAAASRKIERMCRRRLAPFVGIAENVRLTGIDTQARYTYGMWSANGNTYEDFAYAFGFGMYQQPIRDVWVREYAPAYSELWSYSNVTLTLVRSQSDVETIASDIVAGPDPDTGHVRFGTGVNFTPGTTIRVVYSGGYNTIPDDLREACLLQVAKTAILETEPQQRQGSNMIDLDAEILDLIVDYIRRR